MNPPNLSRVLIRRLGAPAGRLLAAAAALLLAAPLLLMLGGALRAPVLTPPAGFEWWPAQMSLAALREAFTLVPLARALLNSALIVAIALPLALLAASAAGYALTQLPRERQVLWLIALLLVASIPLTATWIPRFMLFQQLGLIGSYAPLIAPALAGGSPLLVLLYFAAMRRIPPELVESARLEGLDHGAIWWRVALPLVRPTSFAVGMLAGVLFWGNFMEALLYLKEESQLTAPLMLHALDLLGATQWPVLLAGSAAITLPAVLLFVGLQGFLVSHERSGAWFGR